MAYAVIIRGPAGVGKTAVAKKLAARIGAEYFSFDEIMRANKLDKVKKTSCRGSMCECIPLESFLKANKLILPKAKQVLGKADGKVLGKADGSGKPVVFDGCFYWKEQLDDLKEALKCKVFVFSLHASLDECVRRNKSRRSALKDEDVAAVHKLVDRAASSVKDSIIIMTDSMTEEQVVDEIVQVVG